MRERILRFIGPVLKTVSQCIFDYEGPAQFLNRDRERLHPRDGPLGDALASLAARQLPGDPLGDGESMRAAVGLEPCGLHSVALDFEVKAHPGLPGGAAGLAPDHGTQGPGENVP